MVWCRVIWHGSRKAAQSQSMYIYRASLLFHVSESMCIINTNLMWGECTASWAESFTQQQQLCHTAQFESDSCHSLPHQLVILSKFFSSFSLNLLPSKMRTHRGCEDSGALKKPWGGMRLRGVPGEIQVWSLCEHWFCLLQAKVWLYRVQKIFMWHDFYRRQSTESIFLFFLFPLRMTMKIREDEKRGKKSLYMSELIQNKQKNKWKLYILVIFEPHKKEKQKQKKKNKQ